MAILDQIGLDLGQGNTDYYLADAQARANEAADYDPTATYAVNDLCLYEGVLKQCTTAIPVAEAWDATHWRTVTIGGQIVALRAPFTGATDNTDGASGLVPPPSRGDQNKFLCANGLWVTISAGGSSLGFMPLIATLTAQDWVESSGNYVARIHDTAIISQMTVTGVNFDNAVNVPARVNVVVDGANHDVVLTTTEAPSVSVVAYIALTTDGSTVMEDVSELTTPFIGATSSTDGRQGLVPKPFIADRATFLKGDGSWATPQASEVGYGNTTVGAELGDLNDQIGDLTQLDVTANNLVGAVNAVNGKFTNYTPILLTTHQNSGTLKDKILAMVAELYTVFGNTTKTCVFQGSISGNGAVAGICTKNVTLIGNILYYQFTLNSRMYFGFYNSASDYAIKYVDGTNLS